MQPLSLITLACLLAAGTASASSVKCIICEEVVDFGLKFAELNNTEHALEHAFSSVCSYIYRHDGLRQSHCESMIANYTERLIQMVEQRVSPTEACTAIGVCGGKIAFLKSILSKLLPSRFTSQNHSKLSSGSIHSAARLFAVGVKKVECYACSSLMSRLHTHKDQTIQFLSNYAELACDYPVLKAIPACKLIVDAEIGKAISALDNSLTVHEFCGHFGLCDASSATFNVSSLLDSSVGQALKSAVQMEQKLGHALSDTDNCRECKSFVAPINDWINNPTIKHSIEQDIDAFCAKYSTSEQQCDRQLQSYANRVLDFLDKYTQPEFICKTLGVCSAN